MFFCFVFSSFFPPSNNRGSLSLEITPLAWSKDKIKRTLIILFIVQELRESRGGRPGLSVLTSLLVSVDVKLY